MFAWLPDRRLAGVRSRMSTPPAAAERRLPRLVRAEVIAKGYIVTHDIVIPDAKCCTLSRLTTSLATVGRTIRTGRQRSRHDVVGCQRKSVPTRDSGSGSLRVGSDLGPRHAADLPAHRVAQRRNLAVVTVSCCPEGVGVLRALNEVLATLSPDVLASLRADTWLSHYPRLKRPPG